MGASRYPDFVADSAGSVITYRASRQTLAVLVGVGLGVVLFGVFGAVIFKGSLQEQYFATIAIGLGVIFMPLSCRLVAPISTTLTPSELICRFSSSERRTAIEDIAGVALVQYPEKVPLASRITGGCRGTGCGRNPLLIGRHDQLRDSCQ